MYLWIILGHVLGQILEEFLVLLWDNYLYNFWDSFWDSFEASFLERFGVSFLDSFEYSFLDSFRYNFEVNFWDNYQNRSVWETAFWTLGCLLFCVDYCWHSWKHFCYVSSDKDSKSVAFCCLNQWLIYLLSCLLKVRQSQNVLMKWSFLPKFPGFLP